jgi:glutamate 5-kinase
MNNRFNKIAIKVGSNVLTRADGTLDMTRMSALSDQIATLHKRGVEIVLISSGAVASGKSVMSVNKKMDEVDRRQLFSAVGQAKLINHYWELFREHGIIVGQVLTTKENFADRHHYLNQRNCMQVMLRNNVLPIVNENDTVSVQELMFTDNDELSGLIATMMDMEALIILSNVDGIYDGDPQSTTTKIIEKITPEQNIEEFILPQKSSFGRGGMRTKINIARRVAEQGIDVFVANGRSENILLKILDTESSETVYTHFIASKNNVSSVKKWIAQSEGFAKGEIYINEKAAAALTVAKAVSLLPVGVVRIEGEFEKDDLVKIFDNEEKLLGIGKTQYDSKKARLLLGQKNQKPIVHYDYLYIE